MQIAQFEVTQGQLKFNVIIFQNTIFLCEDSRITVIIFFFFQVADLYFCSLLDFLCFKKPLLLCETSPAASRFHLFILFTRYKALWFCSAFLTFSKHVYICLCLQLCEVGRMSLSTHLLPTTTVSHRAVKLWLKGSGASKAAHAASLS